MFFFFCSTVACYSVEWSPIYEVSYSINEWGSMHVNRCTIEKGLKYLNGQIFGWTHRQIHHNRTRSGPTTDIRKATQPTWGIEMHIRTERALCATIIPLYLQEWWSYHIYLYSMNKQHNNKPSTHFAHHNNDKLRTTTKKSNRQAYMNNEWSPDCSSINSQKHSWMLICSLVFFYFLLLLLLRETHTHLCDIWFVVF